MCADVYYKSVAAIATEAATKAATFTSGIAPPVDPFASELVKWCQRSVFHRGDPRSFQVEAVQYSPAHPRMRFWEVVGTNDCRRNEALRSQHRRSIDWAWSRTIKKIRKLSKLHRVVSS